MVFRRLSQGKGAVVLRLETGAYHSLNETGAILWGLMGPGKSLGRIVEGVVEVLEDVPSELDAEVYTFFADLATRNLIEVQPPSLSRP